MKAIPINSTTKSWATFILIFLPQACTLFEKDETILAEHTKRSGAKIKIYYVGLGATTEDVIQIRKGDLNKPLWVSEKYDSLINSILINDSSLQIVLSNTGYPNGNKLDTFIIDVK